MTGLADQPGYDPSIDRDPIDGRRSIKDMIDVVGQSYLAQAIAIAGRFQPR